MPGSEFDDQTDAEYIDVTLAGGIVIPDVVVTLPFRARRQPLGEGVRQAHAKSHARSGVPDRDTGAAQIDIPAQESRLAVHGEQPGDGHRRHGHHFESARYSLGGAKGAAHMRLAEFGVTGLGAENAVELVAAENLPGSVFLITTAHKSRI